LAISAVVSRQAGNVALDVFEHFLLRVAAVLLKVSRMRATIICLWGTIGGLPSPTAGKGMLAVIQQAWRLRPCISAVLF